ncbi:MAG: hypothetical protein WAO58_10980 [Fimbriimonadaceae bacterium]
MATAIKAAVAKKSAILFRRRNTWGGLIGLWTELVTREARADQVQG